ncbi:hypothetical protein JCM10908_007087 [Rhodotorula pacifica]|uniref:uncharacterized protein n=1 Tax=Rhodotorula pacifica TaxID=1495444 RepID=UPI0031817FC0
MLKRISTSFTKDSASNDLASLLIPPPPGARTPGGYVSPRTSPLPASPSRTSLGSYPFPSAPPSPKLRGGGGASSPALRSAAAPSAAAAAAAGDRSLDRVVLHKTLTGLSALLVALDELRDTSQAQSRARKHVAKATRDLATGFSPKGAGAEGRCPEVEDALMSCATMMEALYEVEEKHAKSLRKEYEGLNEAVARYFRKTAKEEKAHEDQLAELDERVAKATASYHSNARSTSASSQRNLHVALDSMTLQHSAYMETLSSLSAGINHVKAQYSREMASRRRNAGAEFAHALGTMAEREWRKNVESVRKGAESIGRVVAATAWVQPGMEKATVHSGAYDVGAVSSDVSGGIAKEVSPAAFLAAEKADRYSSDHTFETSTLGSRSINSAQLNTPSTFSSQTASSLSASQYSRPSFPPQDAQPSFSPRGESASYGSERANASEEQAESLARAPYASPDAPGARRSQQYMPARNEEQDLAAVAQARDAQADAAYSPDATRTHSPAAHDIGSTSPPSVSSERPRLSSFTRKDSLVATLSRKYSEGEQAATEPPPQVQTASQSRHERSDSRVSQLAKRYSAPPTSLVGKPDLHASHSINSSEQSVTLSRGSVSPAPSQQRYRAYQAAQPLPPASPSPQFASLPSARSEKSVSILFPRISA